MSQPATKEFGKWRSMLWPIHGFELKKFLPMFFLFFFINFNYTILRDTKDTLIVTASGAETIRFTAVAGAARPHQRTDTEVASGNGTASSATGR